MKLMMVFEVVFLSIEGAACDGAVENSVGGSNATKQTSFRGMRTEKINS